MNFKRFHESKNLFDESTLQNGYYGGGDDDYASYRPDDKYRAFAMNLVVGTYTLRIYCDVSIKLLRVSNSIDGRVTVATDDQPYTFTLAGDATIYVSFRNQTTTNNFPNLKVMLNTGSTPLPYEPYSSEVWHDTSHYIHNTSTDTITIPADIYANDTTATVGLKGNMYQASGVSPTTPIQPSECGERTRNLFDYTKTDGIIANKYINQSGSMVTNSEYYVSYPIKVNVGETYTWRFNSNTGNVHSAPTVGFYDSSDNLLSTVQHNISIRYFSFEVPTNCAYIRASVFTRSNAQQEAMLNLGSEALPYEPYGQYKIPISSANTTTPVYLGEVQTTRRIKKLVLTGEEGWQRTANKKCYYINMANGCPTDYLKSNIITTICSHYVGQTNTSSGSNEINEGCVCFYIGGGYELYIGEKTITSATDFKAYLAAQYAAGTPVTVWYVLKTPETAVVNEPIRKIGTYADEVSDITIPTIAGANTISVNTSLQPSEVTVNYKGWHPVADVHEAENGQWD